MANHVRLVTTMWDLADIRSAENRESEIKNGYWKFLLGAGTSCERFFNTSVSAWNIVLGLGDNKKTLLIQREMVDVGAELARTTAGRQLLLQMTQDPPSFPGVRAF